MRNEWIISVLPRSMPKLEHLNNKTMFSMSKDNIKYDILIDGYVMPRMEYYNDLSHLSQTDLVKELYDKEGAEFIDYIKGSFCIIVIFDTGFKVFTDRHAINNYFIYEHDNTLLVSNSLSIISQRTKLEVDLESAAMYSILSHFIGSETSYKNLRVSEAGSYISYENGVLHTYKYWGPEDLFKPDRKVSKKSYVCDASLWKMLAKQYIDYLKPSGISCSLTGGNDSRMVLAALLSLEIDSHTYTFGNPASLDAVIAARVAQAAGIDHSIHFVANPDRDWMYKKASDLVTLGNGIISIQRAHRLDAFENEKASHPLNNMVFTGLMGGEYTKMPDNNPIIIPPLLRKCLLHQDKRLLSKYVINEFERFNIRESAIDATNIVDKLTAFIDDAKGFSSREQMFILLYKYYGCAHHTQEARILGHLFKYPVNLFMDVDFLQMLSKSGMWYPNNRVVYNRLTHSLFMVRITHKLAPQLSSVDYAKKGMYSAEDLLYKRHIYLLKRLKYFFNKDTVSYPPNFYMGNWMYQFCKSQIEGMHDIYDSLFDVPALTYKIDKFQMGASEYDWSIFFNRINLGMNYERYSRV